MVLNSLPKVLYTNLHAVIGKPEEYLAMAFKLAKIALRSVDATIPKTAVAPLVAPEGKAQSAPEEDKILEVRELVEKMTKWKIKVRVMKKCEKKSCRGGEGAMQTIQLVDKNGTEIEALLFDDAINEKGGVLTEGNVYYIKDGLIKPKNKLYSTINNNLVLYLNWKTSIIPTADDPSIPNKVYLACKPIKIDSIMLDWTSLEKIQTRVQT
eukprot:TRINITY_DN88106_c1_g1_i1.p13 TRINITY_DN88106_c1_g1~~TRINITY_DN88106_c1_g1_i1.p13  ORF type:complete len:210 (-),score=34.85 TRINITY_DN88106_c1_g1_i1:1064-1693(-)